MFIKQEHRSDIVCSIRIKRARIGHRMLTGLVAASPNGMASVICKRKHNLKGVKK